MTRFRRIGFGAVAAVLLCMSWATGNAAPMSISYTANDAGGSLWAYDFAVLFDNNDGTWIAGQQFDYLTFGNQQSETGQYGAFGDWTWTGTPTIASPSAMFAPSYFPEFI